MKAAKSKKNSPKTIDGLMTIAHRNAGHGTDIARASAQVVAQRMALGAAAAIDPLRGDHVEFARILPEKVEAFTAAGMVMLTQAQQSGQAMTRLASEEIMATAQATLQMGTCATPVALAQAQSRYACAWFDRTASGFMAMGLLALNAQAGAMAPIHKTVVANADRLGR